VERASVAVTWLITPTNRLNLRFVIVVRSFQNPSTLKRRVDASSR